MKKAKKIDGNILRLLAIFVIIIAVSGITKGTSFLNVGNLQSMAKTLTEYGLMAGRLWYYQGFPEVFDFLLLTCQTFVESLPV